MTTGLDIKSENGEIELTRTTKETKVTVIVNSVREKKKEIKTSLPFLDHMIETIAWRANMNIGVSSDSKVQLSHPIAEDVGIALGRVVLELYKTKIATGVEGFGSASGMIDEAYAQVLISIEGRVNCFIEGPEFDHVENMKVHDLVAFLEGFSQGCRCTLRVSYKGRDPHHSWEAVFRALGLAIGNALLPNEWRKGTISGMKGTLE